MAPESQVIAGLQQAVSDGVNVVSESYGYGALPGANDDLLAPTNDAMVQAGVVVVESAGDSGSSGTVEAPADDPLVIDAAGTNDLRLLAQADGYTNGWEDDNMTTLSSGGTAPNGAVVDLAPPATWDSLRRAPARFRRFRLRPLAVPASRPPSSPAPPPT